MSLNDYIAGAVGGCAGLAVGHPFDTTKVQLQTQQGKSAYAGTWDAIKSIHQHGWARGFFRGLAFPLASYGVVNSVFFGVYGNTLRWLNRSEDDPYRQPTYRDVFIAGCVGGAMQIIPACPIDVIKVVLQSQITHSTGEASSAHIKDVTHSSQRHMQQRFFKGPFQCARAIVRESGVRTLFRGMTAFAIRDIPSFGLYAVVYEWNYNFLHRHHLTDEAGMFASFIAGGMAGVAAWGSIIPVDMVKSRLQADPYKQMYKGIWDCCVKSFKAEGISVFYRGFGVISIRAFPVSAVTFLVYDQILKHMNGTHIWQQEE